MPPQSQLRGLPRVEQVSRSTQLDLPPSKPDTASGLLGSRAETLLNSLQLVHKTSAADSYGTYVGEGFPPVLAKLAFIEMGKLLSEFWLIPKEEDGNAKLEGGRRQSSMYYLYIIGFVISMISNSTTTTCRYRNYRNVFTSCQACDLLA